MRTFLCLSCRNRCPNCRFTGCLQKGKELTSVAIVTSWLAPSLMKQAIAETNGLEKAVDLLESAFALTGRTKHEPLADS
jgi:hypothetical protein